MSSIRLQNDLPKISKKITRKKNINGDNGGTVIRVTKTSSKHIAEKKKVCHG